jgi:hypothetical protein
MITGAAAPRRMRRMFRRDRRGDTSSMIQDCEAMIEGRYVERLEASGLSVPSWAWMNLLAHATDEVLRHAAEGRPMWRRGRHEVWRRARAYLASEILDIASDPGTLRTVQAQVLVPLELEMMLRRGTAPRAPGKWVAWVLSAIEGYTPTRAHR